MQVQGRFGTVAEERLSEACLVIMGLSSGVFREIVNEDAAGQRFDNVLHHTRVRRVGEVGAHGVCVRKGDDDGNIKGAVHDVAVTRDHCTGDDIDDAGQGAQFQRGVHEGLAMRKVGGFLQPADHDVLHGAGERRWHGGRRACGAAHDATGADDGSKEGQATHAVFKAQTRKICKATGNVLQPAGGRGECVCIWYGVGMHIAIACGGSGGHTFPGVVTGQALRRRGHRVTLWLAGREAEASVVKGWDGPRVQLVVRGFQEKVDTGGIRVAMGHLRAICKAWQVMRRDRPDVLLGMGSYSSVPPAVAACMLRVPMVLHEANAVPGRAVAFLARCTRVIGVTFAVCAAHVPNVRTVLTGLPMRAFGEGTFSGEPLRESDFTILVMGGSQGAHALNELATAAICDLRRAGRPVQVIHLAGRADEATVRAAYVDAGVPHLVFGFLDQIERAYRRAQLGVCRSGAGACMELARAALPAILVPLPTARKNHQWHNARELAQRNGAQLVAQEGLTAQGLAAEILALMEKPEALVAMRKALQGLAIPDGEERLADLVEEVGKGKG